MYRPHLQSVLLLAAAALPLWLSSMRETVTALGQAPLLTLQREDAPPPLALLRWSLDLSPEQHAEMDGIVAEASDRLDALSAELLSARMGVALTDEHAAAATRRHRECAIAEAALTHERSLLERRLRGQLTPTQLARVERWEDRARHLSGNLVTAFATVLPADR